MSPLHVACIFKVLICYLHAHGRGPDHCCGSRSAVMKHLDPCQLAVPASVLGGRVVPVCRPAAFFVAHGVPPFIRIQHADGQAQLNAFYVCCSCSSMLMTVPHLPAATESILMGRATQSYTLYENVYKVSMFFFWARPFQLKFV